MSPASYRAAPPRVVRTSVRHPRGPRHTRIPGPLPCGRTTVPGASAPSVPAVRGPVQEMAVGCLGALLVLGQKDDVGARGGEESVAVGVGDEGVRLAPGGDD